MVERSKDRVVALVALVAVTTLALLVLFATPAAAVSTPKLKDANAKGEQLATKFLTLLQTKDAKGLNAFLDPALQLQRADGTGATKAEYLANPAAVTSFELGDTVTAVQHDDVLSVRWTLKVNLTIDGQPYRTTEAPRLSSFRWNGKTWRLVSHANFNVPA